MPVPEMIDAVPGTGPRRCAEPRPEIEASWRRCVAVGLSPDRFTPPRLDDTNVDSALLRAGRFVVERLGRDLHGSGVAALLIDERTCIIDRHADEITRRRLDRMMLAPGFCWGTDAVGTNAFGLATELNGSATVHGPEHYMDALTGVTTVAAPVRDPHTGRPCGALGLVCAAEVANVLLLPMARRGAREIEHALLDDGSARERLLNEAFLQERRRTRGALVLVDERVLLRNAVAARTFTDADRPALWDLALKAVESGTVEPIVFTTRGGTSLRGSVKPVYDHEIMIAALVNFRPPSGHTARSERPTFGWESLTESELALIQLVAEGFTNREAATRLYLSHHTVDSHLRHIFQKLGINSRVQLARMAASTLTDSILESA